MFTDIVLQRSTSHVYTFPLHAAVLNAVHSAAELEKKGRGSKGVGLLGIQALLTMYVGCAA